MRSRLLLLLSAAALAACAQLGFDSSGGESASAGRTAEAAQQDMKSMEEIAQANIAEVATGKLAQSKAQSSEVRQFAARMVDEHSRLLKEGANLAIAKGMPMPTAPGAKHQAALKQLESMSGVAFDQAYMQQMVKDHQATLQLLKQASSQARDAQLRAHVQKAIPHVQQHLATAQRMTADLIGSAR
jgi:putative membrane protein